MGGDDASGADTTCESSGGAPVSENGLSCASDSPPGGDPQCDDVPICNDSCSNPGNCDPEGCHGASPPLCEDVCCGPIVCPGGRRRRSGGPAYNRSYYPLP